MERKLRITVDGKSYIVTVEDLGEAGQGLPAAPPAVAATAPPSSASPPSAYPAAPAVAAAPGDVLALLGGVVESVAVNLGQVVRAGDSIVVLEAMKMKSTMVAPRDGTVSHIAVKSGQAVESGQLLATIG